MAVGELIGAAIGVLLLIFVAYVLVGSTLSTAQTLAESQKDLTLMDESRLKTEIHLSRAIIEEDNILNFSFTNNGSEIVSDFKHMDLLTTNSSGEYTYYSYVKTSESTTGTWTIVFFDPLNGIHPGQLDPGETVWCHAYYPGDLPQWLQVTTGNGVYTSGYISNL
jgi:flagellar protein FlaF